MTPSKATIAANAGAGNLSSVQFPGGKAMFIAEGTWGGGNIKLQVKAGNNTWVDISSSTLSANGTLNLDLPPCEIRGVVTTSTGVYADLITVPN